MKAATCATADTEAATREKSPRREGRPSIQGVHALYARLAPMCSTAGFRSEPGTWLVGPDKLHKARRKIEHSASVPLSVAVSHDHLDSITLQPVTEIVVTWITIVGFPRTGCRRGK